MNKNIITIETYPIKEGNEIQYFKMVIKVKPNFQEQEITVYERDIFSDFDNEDVVRKFHNYILNLYGKSISKFE